MQPGSGRRDPRGRHQQGHELRGGPPLWGTDRSSGSCEGTGQGLTLTTQGFGQHEPLVWLDLHGYSWSVNLYRQYVRSRVKVCDKDDPLALSIRRDTLAGAPVAS